MEYGNQKITPQELGMLKRERSERFYFLVNIRKFQHFLSYSNVEKYSNKSKTTLHDVSTIIGDRTSSV